MGYRGRHPAEQPLRIPRRDGWWTRIGRWWYHPIYRPVPVIGGGSRQYWCETLAWATADGTGVTNTTTETIVYSNITIPANYMQDGRVFNLRVIGKWSSGTGPPTLIFGVRWGGVAGTLLC
jgi:hypothetical protein